MKLKSIEINNFLSYSYGKLDFTTLPPCTLVIGDNQTDASAKGNAAGKSGLIEAITWCLFDLTARGESKGAVLNRNNPDVPVRVVLELMSDNDTYMIVRERGKKFSLDIYKNTVKLEFTCAGAAQSFIENNILQLGYQAFMNSVVFVDTDASFITTSPTQRVSVLRSIFSLDGVMSAKARCSEDRAKAKTKLAELNVRISSYEDMLKHMNIEMLMKESCQWKEKHLEKIRTKQKELDETEIKKVNELEDRLPPDPIDETKLDKYSGVVTELSVKLQDVERQMSAVQALKKKCEQALTDFDAIGPVCNKCKSSLTKEHVQSVHKELTSDRNKYDKQYRDLMKQFTDMQADVRQARALHAAEMENIKSLRLKHKQYSEYLVQKARIDAAKEIALSTYKLKIANLQKEIAELEATENPYDKTLESAKTERARITALLTEAVADSNTLNNLFTVIDFWYPAFKKIEILAMNNIINMLQTRAREYMLNLTDNTLSLKVTLEECDATQLVDFMLLNREKVCTYKSLSGSERQKVKLALFWAFGDIVAAKLGSKCEFALYDEPLHGAVDGIGTELILDAIRTQEANKQMLLISHEDDVKSEFEHTVTIRRTHNGSTIDAN